MQILTNTVIRYKANNSESSNTSDALYRVLHIYPKYFVMIRIDLEIRKKKKRSSGEISSTMTIKEPSKRQSKKDLYPFNKKINQVLQDLHQGVAFVEMNDPQAAKQLIREDQLTPAEVKRRDFAYDVVMSIVRNENGINLDVFSPRKRAQLIKAAADRFKISEKTAYRYLREYWLGGMVRNGSLPGNYKAGARGETRNHKGTKLGKPNAIERREGKAEPLYPTETLRMIMVEALTKSRKTGTPYKSIFDEILRDYFSIDEENTSTFTGIKSKKLVEPKYRLTENQFYYFIEKEWKKKPKLFQILKHGKKRYEQNYRPLLGDASEEAVCPGSLCQIDSTEPDVDLVFSLRRQFIIGKPTVYPIMDVYSQAITGFSIAVKHASWRTALPALCNSFESKVEFCAQYGITIKEDDWPMQGLMHRLLADNAEFATKASNYLPQNLDITVLNAPPYRCDFKGLVERRIGLLNQYVRQLPGGTPVISRRGDEDTRARACLTPYELTQILILTILYYNNFHYLEDFDLDADQIADGVPPIPNALWNWGIANRGGELRAESREKVMLNLLPEGQASSTENGFLFRGKIYHSEDQVMESRLAGEARSNGNTKYPVVYDPWHPDIIYCQLDSRQSFEVLHLSKQHKAFIGLHNIEWEAYDDLQNIERLTAQHTETEKRIAMQASVNAIVDAANAQTEADISESNSTRASRDKDIRSRRESEHALQEGQELPDESSVSTNPTQTFTEITGKESFNYVPPAKTSIRDIKKGN